MSFIRMQHAGQLAGTSKNPIIRAIKKGKIDAEKDNLGHWKIDETSFYRWLSSRKLSEKSSASGLARTKDVQCVHDAVYSSGFMELVSTVILELLRKLDVAELLVWEHVFMQKAPTRSFQLSIIAMIVEQKQTLHALRASLSLICSPPEGNGTRMSCAELKSGSGGIFSQG